MMAISGTDASDGIDPQAEDILRQLSGYLGSLKRFRVDVQSTCRGRVGGADHAMDARYALAVQRPRKLALVLNAGHLGTTVISDGRRTHRYWPALHEYAETPVPETFDAILTEGGAGQSMEVGVPVFVAILLRPNLYAALTENVTTARYEGIEAATGVPCHHIRFSGQLSRWTDWQLWVDEGAIAVPRRFVPDESAHCAIANALNPGSGIEQIRTEVVFRNWRSNVQIPPEDFRFVPPAGARKKDVLALLEQAQVCEKCGRPATVHICHATAGDPAATTSQHLCDACAEAEGLV